jgi:hypothetical protein
MVILTIQTIGALLRDYLGDHMPEDAIGVGLEINPQENGKLAMVMSSPAIREGAKDINAHFHLKRVHTV